VYLDLSCYSLSHTTFPNFPKPQEVKALVGDSLRAGFLGVPLQDGADLKLGGGTLTVSII